MLELPPPLTHSITPARSTSACVCLIYRRFWLHSPTRRNSRGASEEGSQEDKSKPQEEGETFATISGRHYSHADEDDTRALLLKPLVGHESILVSWKSHETIYMIEHGLTRSCQQ